jgi:hypothetical protein
MQSSMSGWRRLEAAPVMKSILTSEFCILNSDSPRGRLNHRWRDQRTLGRI